MPTRSGSIARLGPTANQAWSSRSTRPPPSRLPPSRPPRRASPRAPAPARAGPRPRASPPPQSSAVQTAPRAHRPPRRTTAGPATATAVGVAQAGAHPLPSGRSRRRSSLAPSRPSERRESNHMLGLACTRSARFVAMVVCPTVDV